ncbi:very short patch repair endonuclease [Domibacillus sp. PGB-M46]|uniref:very short patch repair endonuclease n=1 Tax=Domibacillus sp. PGB-M46 TaxID=2910255 RepID=UPI001F585804|nr:very short patch repair endonuclease [Domibacillus sp. PGB-M46]MCI2255777.1 very short patch repair endonuclease [Domibacillus sp. PGB-M46]
MDKSTPKNTNHMKNIRSQSQLENKVSKALWKKGIRFRKNVKLFGTPDIAITKYKIVIFIDSCFWHSCPIHGKIPKTNEEFWIKKLGRNMKRDIDVNRYYEEEGWHLLRIWEHEIKENFEGTIDKIIGFINFHKNNLFS